MKVLALTVSAGAGHVRAAEAIKKGFESFGDDVVVEIVDTLKYINPMVDKVVVGSYLTTVKTTPYIYAGLYKYAEEDELLSSFSELLNDVFSLKLKGLIEDSNPDVILCTHPFPIEMLSILKKKGKVNVPTAAIITDYAPHSLWICSHIDAYIIPNEDFIEVVMEKGVERDIIYPFGIPVDVDFIREINKEEARKKLGLDKNALTLLIMGGGLGLGNMKGIVETLVQGDMDIQLLCVAGRNLKLKEKLESIREKSNKKIIIYDYTNEVSLLMSASDILISKPGGLTIAESLIKGLPIIITSAIPGQEEENAAYLLNNGIAARVKKPKNMLNVLSQLTRSRLRLKHMREMAIEKSKPNAVRDICNLLLKLAEGETPTSNA